LHQSCTLSLVGNAIEIAKISNVSLGGAALAGFNTANLAWRTQQVLCHLLYREPLFFAEPSQQGT
jgi:hypothetical protein